MYIYIFLLLKKVGDCVVCTTCMVRVKGDEAKTLNAHDFSRMEQKKSFTRKKASLNCKSAIYLFGT